MSITLNEDKFIGEWWEIARQASTTPVGVTPCVNDGISSIDFSGKALRWIFCRKNTGYYRLDLEIYDETASVLESAYGGIAIMDQNKNFSMILYDNGEPRSLGTYEVLYTNYDRLLMLGRKRFITAQTSSIRVYDPQTGKTVDTRIDEVENLGDCSGTELLVLARTPSITVKEKSTILLTAEHFCYDGSSLITSRPLLIEHYSNISSQTPYVQPVQRIYETSLPPTQEVETITSRPVPKDTVRRTRQAAVPSVVQENIRRTTRPATIFPETQTTPVLEETIRRTARSPPARAPLVEEPQVITRTVRRTAAPLVEEPQVITRTVRRTAAPLVEETVRRTARQTAAPLVEETVRRTARQTAAPLVQEPQVTRTVRRTTAPSADLEETVVIEDTGGTVARKIPIVRSARTEPGNAFPEMIRRTNRPVVEEIITKRTIPSASSGRTAQMPQVEETVIRTANGSRSRQTIGSDDTFYSEATRSAPNISKRTVRSQQGQSRSSAPRINVSTRGFSMQDPLSPSRARTKVFDFNVAKEETYRTPTGNFPVSEEEVYRTPTDNFSTSEETIYRTPVEDPGWDSEDLSEEEAFFSEEY